MKKQNVSVKIEGATLEDYRRCGRITGAALVRQMHGGDGLESFYATQKPGAVHAAIAREGNRMRDGGATDEQLQAWSDGFAEVLNADCERMDGIIAAAAFDNAMAAMYRKQ